MHFFLNLPSHKIIKTLFYILVSFSLFSTTLMYSSTVRFALIAFKGISTVSQDA